MLPVRLSNLSTGHAMVSRRFGSTASDKSDNQDTLEKLEPFQSGQSAQVGIAERLNRAWRTLTTGSSLTFQLKPESTPKSPDFMEFIRQQIMDASYNPIVRVTRALTILRKGDYHHDSDSEPLPELGWLDKLKSRFLFGKDDETDPIEETESPE